MENFEKFLLLNLFPLSIWRDITYERNFLWKDKVVLPLIDDEIADNQMILLLLSLSHVQPTTYCKRIHYILASLADLLFFDPVWSDSENLIPEFVDKSIFFTVH